MGSQETKPVTMPIRLGEMYRTRRFVLSYELFPPKTDAGRDALRTHLKRLLAFKPDFITCTYGAGGATRDKTLDTLALVRELCDLPLASHLTCVGATVDELRAYLRLAKSQGVAYIVAIRGDAPKDNPQFRVVPGGLRYGNELVSLIRGEFPEFGIAVGGYPEKHPEAPDADADLVNLRRKVDSGADIIISQLFYNNADFYRWRDRCVKLGISVPIVPGVLPITNYGQIKRITSMCGATLPTELENRLLLAADDEDGQFQAGIEHATRQVEDLMRQGVPGIHFYVLNQSRATASVLEAVR